MHRSTARPPLPEQHSVRRQRAPAASRCWCRLIASAISSPPPRRKRNDAALLPRRGVPGAVQEGTEASGELSRDQCNLETRACVLPPSLPLEVRSFRKAPARARARDRKKALFGAPVTPRRVFAQRRKPTGSMINPDATHSSPPRNWDVIGLPRLSMRLSGFVRGRGVVAIGSRVYLSTFARRGSCISLCLPPGGDVRLGSHSPLSHVVESDGAFGCGHCKHLAVSPANLV